MYASINRVILLGEMGRDGATIRYNERGTAQASFTVVLSDVGQDGKTYQTWVSCEVWGKHAERASEIEPGTPVVFEGKLKRQKRGEQWETVISGFDLAQVTLPMGGHA